MNQNLVLVVTGFDATHFLQFSSQGIILATVGTPPGPDSVTVFNLWNDAGLTEDGEEAEPFMLFNVGDRDVDDVWREAVKLAYDHAIRKMFDMKDMPDMSTIKAEFRLKKDMTDHDIQKEYAEKIYDGACELAVKYKDDRHALAAELERMHVPNAEVLKALTAMEDPDYEEISIRGHMIDEGVYEALKDCLRPLHGF